MGFNVNMSLFSGHFMKDGAAHMWRWWLCRRFALKDFLMWIAFVLKGKMLKTRLSEVGILKFARIYTNVYGYKSNNWILGLVYKSSYADLVAPNVRYMNGHLSCWMTVVLQYAVMYCCVIV